MAPKPSLRRRQLADPSRRRTLSAKASRSMPRATSTNTTTAEEPSTPDAPAIAALATSSPATPVGSATDDGSSFKKRKYIPGGAGGGGRFIEVEVPGNPPPPATWRRPRATPSARKNSRNLLPGTPATFPRREKSTRIRNPTERAANQMPYSSAAAVAAAVVQSEGYKPREERSWEEFHPGLDIEATFMVFSAADVDGTAPARPITPNNNNNNNNTIDAIPEEPANGSSTPAKDPHPVSTGNTPNRAVGPQADGAGVTPGRRRPTRPTRDYASLFASRPVEPVAPKPPPPQVLPIHNQTPKERLDLKLPSFRKTNRILLFESKTFGQARYVDKAMSNVGYQESDIFIRHPQQLIKATEANLEEELDQSLFTALRGDGVDNNGVDAAGNWNRHHLAALNSSNRVEYDMDEQDDMWLDALNKQRKQHDLEPVTRELFEITITKIEKEWYALEKRIPKPNPRPPQTHRPRSGSATAVSGEPQVGEEQDTKCAVCDDGDCENTNAIVFCDGCDLAVHQECYGVPFIPEGQWHCRKCQLIGRGIPTCIFCPNTDGAFKQTNSSKWAHLLCAMWIPEASLGNHTFMEPVMDVEKVPKTRWKLTCYICNQKMGACIQCGNKACYQAFHVTCARRARLFLKMKTSQGTLAVLDGGMTLKAFCDKHCPPDYTRDNAVEEATKDAQRHYKKVMRGRIWADNQAAAHAIAATHRDALTEHTPWDSQLTGARFAAPASADTAAAVAGSDKKGQPGQPDKPVWRLPSGAPVIPHAVFEAVESSLQRFNLRKRKDYVADACRYWTLKREARRGAALLKRLQLQMDTFSSMELTRRDFTSMGPTGKPRLTGRIEFAQNVISDLERLKDLSEALVRRERAKLEAATLEQDFVDTCYFPVAKLLVPALDKAVGLDKNAFGDGLAKLRTSLNSRFYTRALAFVHDLCDVIHVGINTEPRTEAQPPTPGIEMVEPSTTRANFGDIRERRKLGRRILKAVQQMLEPALRLESDLTHQPYEVLLKELEAMIDAGLEMRQQPAAAATQKPGDQDGHTEQNGDVEMTDAPAIVEEAQPPAEDVICDGDAMDTTEDGDAAQGAASAAATEGPTTMAAPSAPSSSLTKLIDGLYSAASSVISSSEHVKPSIELPDGPVAANGYVPAPRINQPAPPTPPRSNGSLGKEQGEVLSEGGVPWYLKGFDPCGTTATEMVSPPRPVIRFLSEELTDMDDDELKGLAREIARDSLPADEEDDNKEAGEDAEGEADEDAEGEVDSDAEGEAVADDEPEPKAVPKPRPPTTRAAKAASMSRTTRSSIRKTRKSTRRR